MLSYKARTFYKYWQGKVITSFPKQHTEPAVEGQGEGGSQKTYRGEVLAQFVLGLASVALGGTQNSPRSGEFWCCWL
jgi:hypothetical protein